MRPLSFTRALLAPLLVVVTVAACGSSSKPSSGAAASTASSLLASAKSAAAAAATSAPGAAPTDPVAGDIDCASLKDAVLAMTIDWQVIIGLSRQSDVSQWPDTATAIGKIGTFGNDLDTLQKQVGKDAAASASIAFMRGANDIVQKGLGGDATASASLASYMGSDVTKLVGKQVPIGEAVGKAKC